MNTTASQQISQSFKRSFKNITSIKELEFGDKKVSIAQVYDYLNNKKAWEDDDDYYIDLDCSCNIIELNEFIKKTGAKIWRNGDALCRSYDATSYHHHPASYKTVPYIYFEAKSMYGHTKYVFCIGNLYIHFTIASNAKLAGLYFEVLPYQYGKNDVYLDLETTGLNPLFDDILSIGLLQPSTGRRFHKYLPLEKRSHIPEEASTINGITDEMIETAVALTQAEINRLIEHFDLRSNRLTIWTGNNLFDAVFLHCYFSNHHLTDNEAFNFQNARDAAKSFPYFERFHSFAKDNIARMFLIDTSMAHNSLEDCKIEAQICEAIHNNITPEIPNWPAIVDEINTTFTQMTKEEATKLYNKLCSWCTIANGPVNQDYDKNPIKKGLLGIDIHHIDEATLDDIGSRTMKAQQDNDIDTLSWLEPYNRKNRLVYASHLQHFLLHCLIEKIREGNGGGPHYLFARMFLGLNPSCYKDPDYRYGPIFNIYAQLILVERLTIDEDIKQLWQVVADQNGHKSRDVQNLFNGVKTALEQLKSK